MSTGTLYPILHGLERKGYLRSEVEREGRTSRRSMYPEVSWPAGAAGESLLVPATAVVTTTERTFVIRANNGHAEWVNVTKGQPAGDQVQVVGPLQAGDKVLRRGSDEVRYGTALQIK